MHPITVRHRTASGRMDHGWEASGDVIHVYVRLGNVDTAFAVHVCSQDRPKIGAHPIARINGEAWAVLPSRYVMAFPHRVGVLQPISCGIGDVLAHGQQLLLVNAPPNVDEELAQL